MVEVMAKSWCKQGCLASQWIDEELNIAHERERERNARKYELNKLLMQSDPTKAAIMVAVQSRPKFITVSTNHKMKILETKTLIIIIIMFTRKSKGAGCSPRSQCLQGTTMQSLSLHSPLHHYHESHSCINCRWNLHQFPHKPTRHLLPSTSLDI